MFALMYPNRVLGLYLTADEAHKAAEVEFDLKEHEPWTVIGLSPSYIPSAFHDWWLQRHKDGSGQTNVDVQLYLGWIIDSADFVHPDDYRTVEDVEDDFQAYLASCEENATGTGAEIGPDLGGEQ